MKIRLLQAILGLLLVIVLSGCNDHIISSFKLISDANTMNTRQVATAIDAQGWKHTLWNECFSGPQEHCRLVYARYSVSAPAAAEYKYLVPYSLNYSYIDPDIAVTDAGVAYGVWRLKMTNPNTNAVEYSNCWQNLSTGTSCNVFISNQTNNAAVSGKPRVAAQASTVYAVFEEKLQGGSGTQLFFRRLSPLSNFNYAISPSDATTANTDSDLAVSPAGTLHVVWDDQSMFRYADNVGNVLGIMSIRWNFTSSSQASKPQITIDDGVVNEAMAYVAYAYTSQLKIYSFLCSDASHLPLDEANVDLTSNQPWNLLGTPTIAAAGSKSKGTSTVYGAFTATNAATTGSSQVFHFSYSNGGADPSPTMVSQPADSPTGKSSPLIAIAHDSTPNSTLVTPVIAWRNEWWGPLTSDMFIYNLPSGNRKVFTSNAGAANYAPGSATFDLSSNGTYASGIWIDTRSSTDPRLVPWVSMNGSQVFLPLIKGPAQTYQNDGPAE